LLVSKFSASTMAFENSSMPRQRLDDLGPGTQELVGQHIELRGLVDGLERILPKERVRPGDQVVQVLHHHVFLVRGDALACDQVRLEGIVTPLVDERSQLLLLVGRQVLLEAQRLGQTVGRVLVGEERQEVPVAGAVRQRVDEALGLFVDLQVAAGVEDEVVPTHRVFELQVLAQLAGHQHGQVEEQLPVVRAKGGAVAELDRW
jgi:hypothetical protein